MNRVVPGIDVSATPLPTYESVLKQLQKKIMFCFVEDSFFVLGDCPSVKYFFANCYNTFFMIVICANFQLFPPLLKICWKVVVVF